MATRFGIIIRRDNERSWHLLVRGLSRTLSLVRLTVQIVPLVSKGMGSDLERSRVTGGKVASNDSETPRDRPITELLLTYSGRVYVIW